jgi:hypothetical protein
MSVYEIIVKDNKVTHVSVEDNCTYFEEIEKFHPLELISDNCPEACFIHYIKYGRYFAEWWLDSEFSIVNVTDREYIGEADMEDELLLDLLVMDAAAIGKGRTVQAGHSA